MSAAHAPVPDRLASRSAKQAIIRNSIWLYGAEVTARTLTALLVIVVARRLGPVETGKYLYVASLVAIAGSVSDFGTTQYFIRAAVHVPSSARARLFWLVIGFRILLTVCLAAFLGLYASLTADSETRALLLLAAASLPISAVPGVIAAVFRADERMGFEAIGRVLVAGLTLMAGAALILQGSGVVSLGVVGILAAMAGLVYFIAVARRSVHLGWPAAIKLGELGGVARGAWPFFSVSILVVVYSRLDAIILQQLLGPKAVGEYGVTVRVMEVLFVVPGVLSTTIFPAIAKELGIRPEPVLRYGMRGVQILLFLSFPIALAGTIVGPALFTLVFGHGFDASGTAFRILVWTIMPVFASVVTSSIIAASRKPMVNTYLATGMVVISLVGNLILVPRYGISGAAAVRLVTELSGFAGGGLYIAARIVARGKAG